MEFVPRNYSICISDLLFRKNGRMSALHSGTTGSEALEKEPEIYDSQNAKWTLFRKKKKYLLVSKWLIIESLVYEWHLILNSEGNKFFWDLNMFMCNSDPFCLNSICEVRHWWHWMRRSGLTFWGILKSRFSTLNYFAALHCALFQSVGQEVTISKLFPQSWENELVHLLKH